MPPPRVGDRPDAALGPILASSADLRYGNPLAPRPSARQPVPVLDAPDLAALRAFFAPERPGPLMHAHVEHTGVGRVRVDRWPDPRAVHVAVPGGNHALRGDPAAVDAGDLDGVTGFVEAPPEWLPLLRALDPGVAPWPRLMAALPADLAVPASGAGLLGPDDAAGLAALDAENAWIHDSWGGADALAAARVARAVCVDGHPVSVAVPFYVGDGFEDIGVVTAPGHRGAGYSTACAAALVGDVRARGRVPSWTTSPGNVASRAVAARLGFRPVREDVLWGVGVPIPD